MTSLSDNSRSRFGSWNTDFQLPKRERPTGLKAADFTYDYLKHLIVTLALPPKTIVAENEVAEATGTSRTPVREAFFRLQSEQLLELLPRRGALVPEITLRTITEQAETRVVLEGYGIEWICDHKIDVSNRLQSLINQQAEVLRDDDSRVLDQIMLDKEFHWTLVQATGNTEFSQLYNTLHDRQVRIGMAMFEARPERRHDAIGQHKRIADAIRGGQKDEALAHLRYHLIDSIDQISDVFTN